MDRSKDCSTQTEAEQTEKPQTLDTTSLMFEPVMTNIDDSMVPSCHSDILLSDLAYDGAYYMQEEPLLDLNYLSGLNCISDTYNFTSLLESTITPEPVPAPTPSQNLLETLRQDMNRTEKMIQETQAVYKEDVEQMATYACDSKRCSGD